MNGLNLSTINNAMLGSTQVRALYYGSIAIWSENVEPIDKAYLTPTRTKPTSASIQLMSFPSEKPTEETLETSEINKPTDLYLVYPSAWVTSNANDDITNPIITDPNGFPCGAWVDSIVTVDGVQYTIIGTNLGKDTFTITFN